MPASIHTRAIQTPASDASREILIELVHDLRQPLGNLETSVFYLDLVLTDPAPRVREQLEAMERQLACAAQLLERVVRELQTRQNQEVAGETEAVSFDLTNSVSAGVT